MKKTGRIGGRRGGKNTEAREERNAKRSHEAKCTSYSDQ